MLQMLQMLLNVTRKYVMIKMPKKEMSFHCFNIIIFSKNARLSAGQGGVEQLAARLAHNQEVAGSNPAFATSEPTAEAVRRKCGFLLLPPNKRNRNPEESGLYAKAGRYCDCVLLLRINDTEAPIFTIVGAFVLQ